jgi:hypothetical protein
MLPPELPDPNVVSEDGPVGELEVRLVPHELQLSGREGADADVARRPLRPLPIRQELEQTPTLTTCCSVHMCMYI